MTSTELNSPTVITPVVPQTNSPLQIPISKVPSKPRGVKTTQEDLRLINNFVLPCLVGTKPFREMSGRDVHMGYNETAVFQAILSSLRPQCSIEVGTETGATLALISKHSTRAISIDIDAQVKTTLSSKFSNVEFITGDSHQALPEVLKKLTAEGTTPDFIFIDGDHSADGVRQDIEHVLSFRPTKQMTVLMHDSFNPNAAKACWPRNGVGMLSAISWTWIFAGRAAPQ